MSLLKIIHITPNGSIGGRERQVNLLLRELSKDKDTLQNDLLFIRPEGPFYEESLNMSAQVYSTDLKPYDPRYFSYMFSILKKYDVVNFWGISYYLFFVSLLLDNIKTFTLTGTRFMANKNILDIIHGILNYRHKQKADLHTPMLRVALHLLPAGLMSNLNRALRKKLFISFLKKCSLIITPSNFLKKFVIDQYGLFPGKVRTIPNFLDFDKVVCLKTSDAVREELGINPKTYLVGVVARFDTRKRLDRMVTSMKLIPAHLNVMAVIFGDGDKGERRKIENEIKQAGMCNRILLPGFRMDIYDCIHALDMFVLPSEAEGFGLVLLEAMYLRVPCVVFGDGGGVLEVVKNDETGFVVNTEKELADLIQMKRVNRNGIKEIADRGYYKVITHYGPANAAMYRESFEHAGLAYLT